MIKITKNAADSNPSDTTMFYITIKDDCGYIGTYYKSSKKYYIPYESKFFSKYLRFIHFALFYINK